MALDLDAIRKELEKRKEDKKDFGKGDSDRPDILFYSLPSGTEKVLLRFAPPLAHERIPGRVVYTHWGVGPDNAKINCYRTYGLDCPYCEMLREYESQVDVKEFAPSGKAYFNVWILSDPTYENRYGRKLDPKQVHVLGAGEYNYEWLLDNLLNPEVGDITDPLKGANVTFERERKDGKFKRTVSRGSTPISSNTEEVTQMLEKLHDLGKVWRSPDDTYHAKMKDAVAYTRDILENKILTLSTNREEPPKSGNNTPPKSSPPPASTPSSAPSAPPAAQANAASSLNTKAAANKPVGAPDCFGVKEMLKNEEHYKNKCQICPFEYNCASQVGG